MSKESWQTVPRGRRVCSNYRNLSKSWTVLSINTRVKIMWAKSWGGPWMRPKWKAEWIFVTGIKRKEKKNHCGSRVIQKGLGEFRRGAAETNPTRNQEAAGLIPGLAQWVEDPAWLWLWCRPGQQLRLDPSLGTSICHGCGPKTTKKKKKDFRQ